VSCEGRIALCADLPARAGRTVALPPLDPAIAQGLRAAGIGRLFQYQAEALERAQSEDLVITAPTASGKTLAFLLPCAQAIAAQGKTALLLYPTKALAEDQLGKLERLFGPEPLRPAVYSGDTPLEARGQLRRWARLVLATPDMVHCGLLPYHRGWQRFLGRLAYIAVDEAHFYRGVFGSEVATVLARLRRLAAAYGARPRLLFASATIANPVGFACRLGNVDRIGRIGAAGAPRPARRITVIDPPALEDPLAGRWPYLEQDLVGRRRSTLPTAAALIARLVAANRSTICFVRTRQGAEHLAVQLEERLRRDGARQLAERIATYHAAYTPARRRQLERRLRAGELLALITTNALELGVDIGSLDCAVVVGFPGTIASLRQMWGRAGRQRRGLAYLIAGEDAIDQYLCRHPRELLERPLERALLDPANPHLLQDQLVFAAAERPLAPGGEPHLPRGWEPVAEQLVGRGALAARGGRLYPAGRPIKPIERPLRSPGGTVRVVELESGELLGEVGRWQAPATLHPGAAYLHDRRHYEVRRLDLQAGVAELVAADGSWGTICQRSVEVEPLERPSGSRRHGPLVVNHGELQVSEQVVGYVRFARANRRKVERRALELEPRSFQTKGLWFDLPDRLAGRLAAARLPAALHALEHGMAAVLALLAMCDPGDIGGLSTTARGRGGTVFLYDGQPGGVGICEVGFGCFAELLRRTAELIGDCGCREGCPSCIQSPHCGNLNEALDKGGALELLSLLSPGGPPPPSAVGSTVCGDGKPTPR